MPWCSGSFHSTTMEYSQLLLQSRIPGKELLLKTDLLFFFPLIFLPTALSFPTRTSSGFPTLPAWAKTEQHHRAERDTAPISTSATGNPLLFGLNCPDSLPWILFFPLALPHHHNHPTCECTTKILFTSPKLTPKKPENLPPNPPKKSHGFTF